MIQDIRGPGMCVKCRRNSITTNQDHPPMDKGPLRVHEVEFVVKLPPRLRDGGRVA